MSWLRYWCPSLLEPEDCRCIHGCSHSSVDNSEKAEFLRHLLRTLHIQLHVKQNIEAQFNRRRCVLQRVLFMECRCFVFYPNPSRKLRADKICAIEDQHGSQRNQSALEMTHLPVGIYSSCHKMWAPSFIQNNSQMQNIFMRSLKFVGVL